jgi:hypothetical protein
MPDVCRCARHEKAVNKLMKSSFTSGASKPQALFEQRRALMTAVVAARERRQPLSHDYATWFSFSSSSGSCCSTDSESGSHDGAAEDEEVVSLVTRSSGHSPAATLPWRGSPRLPTVVESDEEEYATPRAGSFS